MLGKEEDPIDRLIERKDHDREAFERIRRRLGLEKILGITAVERVRVIEADVSNNPNSNLEN